MKLQPLTSPIAPVYPIARPTSGRSPRLRRLIVAGGVALSLGLGGCAGYNQLVVSQAEPEQEEQATDLPPAAPRPPDDHGLTPEEVHRNQEAWLTQAASWEPSNEPLPIPREEPLRMSGAVIEPGLGHLRQAIQRHAEALSDCFEPMRRGALPSDALVQVTMELEVKPNGRLEARVVEGLEGREEVALCLNNLLSGLRSPSDTPVGYIWRLPLIIAPEQQATRGGR